MLVELYVSSHSFHHTEFQSYQSMQNALGYKPSLYAIRPVVAKTQEIIPRVFPP